MSARAQSMADLFTGQYPVLGKLDPWSFLGDEWGEYFTPTMHGLARVRGRAVDVLVMNAVVPGRGDGGRFLAALLAEYEVVRVLDVFSPELRAMLERRGFVPFVEGDGFELVEGFRWQRRV